MEGVIMDSDRFDGLVRSFGHGATRRQLVRWLGGAGIAASAIGGTAVSASPLNNGRACCAQEQRGCKALCRDRGQKFNKATFSCIPGDCVERELVDCLASCV